MLKEAPATLLTGLDHRPGEEISVERAEVYPFAEIVVCPQLNTSESLLARWKSGSQKNLV
jgi:hypothetical protein